MRYLWMPRLVERIQAAASTATTTTTNNNGSPSVTTTITSTNNTMSCNLNTNFEVHSGNTLTPIIMNNNLCGSYVTQSYTPENSSNGSDSFGTQVSPISELNQDYYNVPVGSNNNNNNPNCDYFQQAQQFGFLDCITSPTGLFPQMDFNSVEPNTPWINQGDNFWNDENMLLFQQLNDNM